MLASYKSVTAISNMVNFSYRAQGPLLFVLIALGSFSVIPLFIVSTVQSGPGIVLGAILVPVLLVVILRWPVVGLYVVSGCVAAIEQGSSPVPMGTDNWPIYSWPAPLEGLIERPIGVLFLTTLVVITTRNIRARRFPLQGGKLLLPLLGLLLCVGIAIVRGLFYGGNVKIIVIEIRPFWYLFLAYLLSYNLVTSIRHVRTMLWIVILGVALKALQGCFIYFVLLHGDLTNYNEIMTHEESFFFVGALLLLVIFQLYHSYRPQFYTLLCIAPCVLVALVANQRRADYIALLVALFVAWLLIFLFKPDKRKVLSWIAVICLMSSSMYIVVFSQLEGTIAAPARGIISIFEPEISDRTESDSNLYRDYENADLKYTAQQHPLFGYGFGREFLQIVVLHDISDFDPNYLFIPHNTIYWVWMRQGLVGYFALWYLFGTLIIRGCLIAKKLSHLYLRLIAIYSVAMVFIEIMVAYADYQFFAFRNVIYLGLLAGMLMKLPEVERRERERVRV